MQATFSECLSHLKISHMKFSLFIKSVLHLVMSNIILKPLHTQSYPTCLLLVELLLNLLVVAGVVDDGPGQLGLDVSQPRAQTAHVFVQLLHGHQGLPQLLHPGTQKENALLIVITSQQKM